MLGQAFEIAELIERGESTLPYTTTIKITIS